MLDQDIIKRIVKRSKTLQKLSIEKMEQVYQPARLTLISAIEDLFKTCAGTLIELSLFKLSNCAEEGDQILSSLAHSKI